MNEKTKEFIKNKKIRQDKVNMYKNNITSFDYIGMPFWSFIRNINNLVVIIKIVKNWQDVLLFRLGLKQRFTMIMETGEQIEINKSSDYFRYWNSDEGQMALMLCKNLNCNIKIDKDNKLIGLRFKTNNRMIKFHYDSPVQLSNTLGLIRENFIEEQYQWLNVKDKVVIDIGANIGDTAIYFALKGARHVYAFEPYPYSYNLAKKNINLNKLNNKISSFNQGIGAKRTTINIKPSFKNYGGSDLKNFEGGKSVEIITLKDIVKRFNIKHAILKIDCEGCEYGAILNAPNEILRKFDQIMIEYHYGYLNLKAKLENAGFKVRNTIPHFLFNDLAENHDMIIGCIYAKR